MPRRREETGKAATTAEPGKAEKKPARATASRRPGAIARLLASIAAPFASIRMPRWDVRTFAYVLVALIVLAILIENWDPVRLNLFGLRFEMPKAIAFALDVALGAMLMWLWLYHRRLQRTESSE